MQLFYHGTRDIELPTAIRRVPAPSASRHCEACGKELSPEDASETGAQGLAFCAECRGRLDRSAIQIHFCDACGISVPLGTVQGGSALTADGRILCPACRAPRTAPAKRMSWEVAVVLAALVLGSFLAWLWS